ncbi:serine/threonine-protein kinase S6KL isoform X2 [Neocloeon triangulifer]|uniref:serine/threonine-protein kinase S6KL isoform X2 n=1 Tax=Neocloeon triangulifer TaxID=2078957 RepID=UPI00286F803D|nr:serine/threonine-protein kinase S6KL isoform X2 [Neocloeon triangulifer]
MGNVQQRDAGAVTAGCAGLGAFNQRHRRSSSEYNLSGLSTAGSGCFRSWSSASTQSTYSVSRPWSRVSRHRWRESTLNDKFEAAKTAWPVPLIEAAFLPEFKIGTDVNEHSFELLNSLASGSYGKVYHVRKRDTGEQFALKVLSKSQLISESGVNQVKNEVSIQSMCGHHPFILNCPFYWQSRKKLFIVSEYMPGGELLALWQKYGALPQELSRIYIAELALALDFLHNAGVIFRDLKLENVMVDASGHLKVIDFGMAKWLKHGERTRTLCGTVRYMAPELVSMEPYGHAVDWWSLGIIAFCLITGDFPARRQSPAALTAPDAAPGRCDAAGRDLLARLLHPDPQKRLRSLLTLHTIAFFKDFNFADIRARKLQKIDTIYLRK